MTRSVDVDVDVLIVGAGPSGLVAAIRLLERGLTVEIVDAAPHQAEESRAALMHAATVEILAGMGLASQLLSRGQRIDAITLADGARPLARITLGELDTPYPFALGIPQDVTEAILVGRLAELGLRVTRGIHIETVTQDTGRCRVEGRRTADDEPWTGVARYVVGADGKNSTVREQAGIPYDGAPYEDDFILADVELAPPPSRDTEARIGFSPEGVTVIGRLPSGRYRIVASVPREPEAPRHPDRSYLDRLLASRGIPTSTAGEPVWSSRFRISHHVARRFRAGPIVLCGDAAHVHSPAAGQGMNTGIADAYELADRIASAASGDVTALDAYDRIRRRAAAEVVRLTDRITRVALVRSRTLRATRDAVIPVVAGIPPVGRGIARAVSGLGRSPLH
ncbi:FAD-dependent oxidoreductase [Leifsonia sp. SIMBA_070]|uniref:FAD-dependent oxidoreductase n=2 Tax=Bacillati TaxID=1783272 RepID=UPI00397DB384